MQRTQHNTTPPHADTIERVGGECTSTHTAQHARGVGFFVCDLFEQFLSADYLTHTPKRKKKNAAKCQFVWCPLCVLFHRFFSLSLSTCLPRLASSCRAVPRSAPGGNTTCPSSRRSPGRGFCSGSNAPACGFRTLHKGGHRVKGEAIGMFSVRDRVTNRERERERERVREREKREEKREEENLDLRGKISPCTPKAHG